MATKSANRVFHAIALEKGLLSKEALDQALTDAEANDRPLERFLVESGKLSRDAARDVEITRTRQARACTACRKLTYLLPKKTEADTPCEHCGGALAPPSAPKAGATGSFGPKGASASGVSGPPKAGGSAVSGPPKAGSSAVSGPPKAGSSAVRPPVGSPKSDRHAAPAASERSPAPKSGPHAAPKSGGHAAPKSGGHAAPKSGGHAAPATPKSAPYPAPAAPGDSGAAAIVEEGEDAAPLPTKLGRTRIEALVAEDPAVVVYVGRSDDEQRIAVRVLRPERAEKRKEVDAFYLAAQIASKVGLTPFELGQDELGAPFFAVLRPDDDEDLGQRLLALEAPPPGDGEGPRSSDTSTLIFERLQRERQELMRAVGLASRQRDRCVGPFVLLDKLATDAGELWKAFDTTKEEVVACRVLRAGAAVGADGRLQRPLDELITATTRLRHPNVLACRAHGVDGDRVFIVRDLVAGQSILGPASLETALRWGILAAQGLVHLHSQGIAHGGLHAGMVLLRGDGSVTIVDPGVAAVAAAGDALGLPWQLARGGIGAKGPDDKAGDVRALAALLFRATSRWLPDQPPAHAAPFDSAGDTLGVLRKGMQPEADKGYPSALELAKDLARVLQNQVPTSREKPPAPPPPAEQTKAPSVVGTLSGVFKKWLGRE